MQGKWLAFESNYTPNTHTMDIAAWFDGVNWLAVLTAAVTTFILGAVWYNPKVMGTIWMRGSGMTEEKIKQGNMGKTFGVAFIMGLITAMSLGIILKGSGSAAQGALTGFVLAVGFTVAGFGTHYLYEQRPWPHFIANAGYEILKVVVMGAIIGAWA